MHLSKAYLLASVASLSIFASTQAFAGGFALREQSAQGLGSAFAGAAAGGAGLSSMFWNPATMTSFAGLQTSSSWSVIIPHSNITPTTGTSATLLSLGGSRSSGDIGQDAILPASYASYQFNDRLWFGLSVNTPYGLVTQNPNNWSGQIYGRTSKVFSAEVTPTVAYAVNDWFSVGFGLRAMYFKTRLTSANDVGAAALGASARNGVLTGDDVGFGFSVGATFKPFAGTEIGVGYRSRVTQKLEGTFDAPGGVSSTGLAAGSYSIKSDLVLPDQVTVGVRQQITSDLTLLAGWEWTHWGLFDRFPVTTSTGATATTLYFDYRDSWFASIGAEYKWNPNLTLRAGLGFEKSPVKDDTRSVRLPDSDRTWASLGMTYKSNQKLSIDASYSHLFARSGTINVVPGNPTYVTGLPFVATTKGRVDIISIGLNYRWDEPARPANRPVLVTKG